VDATREYDPSYKVKTKQIFSTGKYLDYRVTPYFEAMMTAAKKAGITLNPYSAYRSYEHQKTNLENFTRQFQAQGYSRAAAEKKAQAQILPPGTSEHNLGLAVDINGTSTPFEKTKAFAWLQQHAHEYGFILRYPKGKEAVTGIVYEPWHWRFVGTALAPKIRESGLTLEEYLPQHGYLI